MEAMSMQDVRAAIGHVRGPDRARRSMLVCTDGGACRPERRVHFEDLVHATHVGEWVIRRVIQHQELNLVRREARAPCAKTTEVLPVGQDARCAVTRLPEAQVIWNLALPP